MHPSFKNIGRKNYKEIKSQKIRYSQVEYHLPRSFLK